MSDAREAEGAKPELEFHLPAGPWRRPPGAGAGVSEQILAADGSGSHTTALVRWEPGTDTSRSGVARHDGWEEVYLLEGSMRDLTLGRTFSRGFYACRPPGMPHGPWVSEEGVTMLVITYPEAAAERRLTGPAAGW
ncbi:cupin [Streptomyces violaceusniger]|uniref:Cupin domain-containing protein n=3 Tax=Streptomyces TaxID=1883 RepID=A0ABD5JNP1_9ACTN|nr:cupin domain-containing protein [Streptomyces violaceusniger]KUL64827.1 cupin [Streptomyces violaceusniger]MEE4590093.1 cupin domain-containing protein [Streptomyces sp. DSM 41602]